MNKLIIIAVLSFSFTSFAKKHNDMKEIPGDDPGKFNWTNPDLFRWNLNGELGELEGNYIEDKENIALRGNQWSCKVSKTKRSTWTIGGIRYFSESRKVTCSYSSFNSQIEATCKLGFGNNKKVVFVHADSAWMDVGVGKKLKPIFLGCETWHDRNQNNKNDPYEWRVNVREWEPEKDHKNK